MQSTKFLFNKIKNRIKNNHVFSTSIYYPSSQHVRGNPVISINQENNKIYVCAPMNVRMYVTYDELEDYELTKEFLSPYTYYTVLRTHIGSYRYRVIYELFPKNNRTH